MNRQASIAMGEYVYKWPRPMVTVDAAVFACCEGGARLLLIQRRHEPFAGRWALPGGFVEMDEDLPQAAARELAEETGLEGVVLEQLHTFGRPGRDPRGRTISVVYFGVFRGQFPSIRAGDDAAAAQWFDVDHLPPMAFDHDDIARCAVARLRRRQDV